ncbi:TPA: hypothetical protein ACH3X3_009724 [Trebouxia sp. C0006]
MGAEAQHTSGPRRSFYLFRPQYEAKHIDNIKQLREEHQQMASLLAEAEQQGLIDVFLVMVTSTGFSAPHRQLGRSKADGFYGISEHQKTTVAHWRRLDGSETALEEETLDLESGDCILQGANWLSQHAYDAKKGNESEDVDTVSSDEEA